MLRKLLYAAIAANVVVMAITNHASAAPTLSVKSMFVVLDQPDTRFAGELVDVVSVSIKNNSKKYIVEADLTSRNHGQPGATPMIIDYSSDIRLLPIKGEIKWMTRLAPGKTKFVTFYVRSTEDDAYCVGKMCTP